MIEHNVYGGKRGSKDEVRYYEYFRNKYRGITETQQSWIDEVLRTKKLRTEWGLVYYWPDTKRERSGYVRNETSICNYPVQAFATAEMIPVALVMFWHYVKAYNLQMFVVNTVHDSIIVELPKEEIEEFHQLSQQCLIDEVYTYLDDVYNVNLIVELGAGVKAASNWNGDDGEAFVPEGREHDKGEVTYTYNNNNKGDTIGGISKHRDSLPNLQQGLRQRRRHDSNVVEFPTGKQQQMV